MQSLDESIVNEKEMMESVLTYLNVGWWKIDLKNQCYIVSENIRAQVGLKSCVLAYSTFLEIIRPDFQELIAQSLQFKYEANHYDQQNNHGRIFPVNIEGKEFWLETESINDIYSGVIKIIPNPNEAKVQQEVANLRHHNLFEQLNTISHNLLSFLQTDDRDAVVNSILRDLLKSFQAGRAYIIEYKWEQNLQVNTYEVVDEGITEEQELFVEMSIDFIPWWTKQIKSGKQIILNTLDDLPPEAGPVKELLAVQDINSLFVTPLFSRDGVWAYGGIDIVDGYHTWTTEDIKWLTSLFNILSICIELQRSEKKVEQERDYFKDLCEYMPIGYMSLKPLYDDDNNIVDYLVTDVNHAAEKIVGVPKNNLIGSKGSDSYQNYEECLANLNEILKTKTNSESTTFFEKTGRYCNTLIYSAGPDRMTSLLSDVTELLKTNQILDQKEKLLRNIFDNLPAGIELYDKDGYLTDFNIRNSEIFGISRQDIGINIFDDPNISDEIKEKLRKQEQVSFQLDSSFDMPSYYNSSRTDNIDIYVVATPLYDAQGDFINYLFINIDKTEINEAYSKILEFERSFSLVSEFGKIGYCKFDLDSQTGFAIPQWYKNLGESKETPLNEVVNYHRAVHKEDREILHNHIDRMLQDEIGHFYFDFRVLSPEGVKWTRANVMKNIDSQDPKKLGFICVNYDITELKDTENKLIVAKDKAESSDRLKSAFLANMSHEIRTPLNAIVGFSELLSESNDQEDKAEYVKIVQKNNDLLLQLISDILDLSRIEAGTLEFSYNKIAANQLCTEIIASFSNMTNSQVEIIFEEPIDDCYFTSDVNRLKQILSNFINNALKFTSEGQIILGYHLLDEHNIKFYVQDSGCGIPKKKLKNVFERFVKLDSFAQGTGLGLSICKSIIDQLGAEIGVDSELGKGTCFWFILPRQ